MRIIVKIAILFYILAPASAFAQFANWNVATGKWETATNWNPAQVPGSSNSVFIDNGGTAQVDNLTGTAESYGLVVGNSGTGTLTITGGGKVTSSSSDIGFNGGSSGTVTVDGADSLLHTNSSLFVGNSGTGTLTITGGGKVTSSSNSVIGSGVGSSGTVTVDGADSLLHANNGLFVGSSGTGTLTITGGGKATSFNIGIGGNAGSNGTVTVDGANSLLQVSAILSLGYDGTGELSLSNGGKAISGDDMTLAGSSGTATVTVGSGSELTSTSGNIYVGGGGGSAGGTGLLAGTGTVSAGGTTGVKVWNTGTLSAGDSAGAIGILNITGNLNMVTGSTLAVDLATGNSSDLIAVSGAVTGGGTVNTNNIWTDGTYTLLSAASGINATNFSLNTTGLAASGKRAGLSAPGASTLKLDVLSGNTTLTWTGATDGNWDATTANWINDSGINTFKDGDIVNFTNLAGTPSTINVTNSQVAAMNVTGGDYTFTSGTITSTATGTLPTPSEKLTVSGGKASFANDVTFTNGAEVTGGTLQIGNGGLTGSITGNIAVGPSGTVRYYRSDNSDVITNTISGAGTIRFGGTGVQNQSSYKIASTSTGFTGNVIVESGARLIAEAATSANIQGTTVENGGQLYLADNANYRNDISIAGDGWLEGGGGPFGALRLGDGATASGNVTLTSDASIGVQGPGTTGTVSGIIDGNYAVEKVGDGTLVLSGANTYSSGTAISGGTLEAVGQSALGTGAVSVGSGAGLELNLAADETLRNNIAFDSSSTGFTKSGAGTLTINQPLNTGQSFNLNAGNLNVQLGDTPTTAAITAGTFTNAGGGSLTVVKNDTAGLVRKQSVGFMVLEGIDANTEFDGLGAFSTSNTKITFDFFDYLQNGQVWLYLTLNQSYVDYNPLLSRNAQRVAAIADGLPAGNPFLTLLDGVSADADIISALSNAHGEIYAAGIQGAEKLQRNFNDELLARKILTPQNTQQGVVRGQCPGKPSVEYWGKFTGGTFNRSNIGMFSGYDLNAYGVAVGAEKRYSRNGFGGVAFGYDNARQQLDDIWAKDDLQAARVSLYGGYAANCWYGNGYGGYAKNWHDVSRSNFALGTQNFGKYNDDIFSTGVEFGRVYGCNSRRFIPSIGLHYVLVDTPQFTESGSAATALAVTGDSYNSLRLPVGFRMNRSFTIWTPEVRAFYVAELADTSSEVQTAFIGSSGIIGDSGNSGRNGGQFGAGLNGQLTKTLSVGIDYDYEVWEHYDRHNFAGNVTMRW